MGDGSERAAEAAAVMTAEGMAEVMATAEGMAEVMAAVSSRCSRCLGCIERHSGHSIY